ncbi:uncharacterized protein [Rutidosis leptorrhynchoides]|uniref:uncharacterized protein n=1 Tax=Rutidosis leptorrhynchoides TaxID=125765 RepID=UPI003A99F60A
MCTEGKQDEVKNLIKDERLCICAVLETHLKAHNIDKACKYVFRRWHWRSNIRNSPNSCRIILGWNNDIIKVTPIHEDKQVMFCLFELRDKPVSWFGSCVYASNNGRGRRKLWRELEIQSNITKNRPWIIFGDFTVTRRLNEHTAGGSFLTDEMHEFNDCVNKIEVDDIGSSGFHYTWTRSLKNPNCGILKKLDRILINEEFLTQFPQAYGRFLLYVISDHSPAVLGITKSQDAQKKSFRFMNYIAYKDGFRELVNEEWSKNIHGYAMFRVVKKLENLKKGLKSLNWKNGNLHEKVEALKADLKEIQKKVDDDPYEGALRKKATEVLEEYENAKMDELRLLYQKAKIDWLIDGDKNTKYFHSILKSRKHKSRVESICDENGNRYFDEQVAEQCVRHFQQFLGVADNTRPVEELGKYIF